MKIVMGVVCCGLLALLWFRERAGEPEAEVTSKVLVSDVIPFGVNLGVWTTWGADQLSSNIVKNPGFEGIVDRAIVVPVHVAADSFDDSPVWLARAESFWDGAKYDIRSGPAAGTTGVISRSIKQNVFGLPSFVMASGTAQAAKPYPGDAVAVTRESDNELPAQWWFDGAANSFAPECSQVRPGSPGTRSLRMTGQAGQKAELISYFDAIGERAGKLLPLGGEWDLSFWTRLSSGSAALHVQFGRDGSAPLLSKDIALSSGWTRQHLVFAGSDAGSASIASLRFRAASQSQGQILLDDVDLRRTSDMSSPFRHEVLSVLEDLHPRYLRDWEGQLGDTLANRTATTFARKSYRYRPGDASQSDFGYGLADFLDLCAKIGANPWITIPTTFSDDECGGLGSYLEGRRDKAHFSEIITEFGNENWNEIFRPAGILDARAHGEAADRCFAAIRKHATGLPLKTVLNAQHVYTASAINFAKQSGAADIEAIAPYFLSSMAEGTPREDALHEMFAGDRGALQTIAKAMPGLHKELAIYEVNSTALAGTATGAQRNPVIAGRAAGAALAKTMLDALNQGVRRQCVYSLSGFDNKLPGDQGFVRLFGITRDLGPTNRMRPTGLALKMLNQVLGGELLQVKTHHLANVFVYGFHSERGWAAAVVSARDTPVRFDLQFPSALPGPLPSKALTLSSKAWDSTNEDSAEVSISEQSIGESGQKISYEIAPWTLAVLVPGGTKR